MRIFLLINNMLNGVGYSQVNFSGKSFKFPKGLQGEYLLEKYGENHPHNRNFCETNVIKAKYAPFINENVELRRENYGYAAIDSSPLELYKGTTDKTAGLSTESGGYGGGWVKANLDTPLSTKDIHTCAGLHLVNEFTNEHLLYHVHHDTLGYEIQNIIKNIFPDFNKVNIIPGDQPRTQNTTNSILNAVKKINRKAEVKFYHNPINMPEIIAYKGEMSYLPSKNDGSMTFTEVVQYASDIKTN